MLRNGGEVLFNRMGMPLDSNDLIGILLGLRISGDICHNDFIENITNKNEVIFLQEIN